MGDACNIRHATPEDVGLILYFIRQLAEYEKLSDAVIATEEGLRHSLFGPNPRAHVIFALVQGSEVGFALYFYNYSTFLGKPGLYIEDVFVEEAYRGQGIGKALFRHLAKQAAEEGCGRMEWWVLDWNAPSIAFYEKMGAIPMSEWTVYRLEGQKLLEL